MDTLAARALIDLNNGFYRENASSFSKSRSRPWEGWERVLRSAGDFGSVFDLGCGNLRFERELLNLNADLRFTCVDSCEALVEGALNQGFASEGEGPGPDLSCGAVSFVCADVLSALLEGKDSDRLRYAAEACDLAVCFGFMHHVPGADLRGHVLALLLDHLRPGGVAALSFWRFLELPALRDKADREHARALEENPEWASLDFDEGDRLLGWQGRAQAFRYCHSFAAGEIDQLVDLCAGKAELIDRFCSDGSQGSANEYLVLRRL